LGFRVGFGGRVGVGVRVRFRVSVLREVGAVVEQVVRRLQAEALLHLGGLGLRVTFRLRERVRVRVRVRVRAGVGVRVRKALLHLGIRAGQHVGRHEQQQRHLPGLGLRLEG